MKTTYITFGSTNPYQASSGRYCGLFRGRTKVAIRVDYCTKEDASKRLMQDCLDESDNYAMNAYGTKVEVMISCDEVKNTIEFETIMEQGDMTYHHDGYGWESIALADLDEEEARVALRDNVLFDEADRQYLYDKFPALAPVEADEE